MTATKDLELIELLVSILIDCHLVILEDCENFTAKITAFSWSLEGWLDLFTQHPTKATENSMASFDRENKSRFIKIFFVISSSLLGRLASAFRSKVFIHGEAVFSEGRRAEGLVRMELSETIGSNEHLGM